MSSSSQLPAPVQDPKSAYNALRTKKQRDFVRAYCTEAHGNATEAARLAGYTGSEETLRKVASENLTKPHIADAIREFEEAAILSEEEVRRRLGKQATASFADFFDIVEVEQFVEYGRDQAVLAQALDPDAVGASVEQATQAELEEAACSAGGGLADVVGGDDNANTHGTFKVAKVTSYVPVLNLEKAKRRGKLHLIKSLSWDRHGRPRLELYSSQKALFHLSQVYQRARGETEDQVHARAQLESVANKMGLDVNILHVQL